VLEKHGLGEALRLRLEAVEARSGLSTDLQVDGTERLPYGTKVELYQIVQEALNNILKHAHATKVYINLRFLEGLTCLEVIDDGQGFDPGQASRGGGLGLPGVAERVEKIGGRLQIDSAPGNGTILRVEAPSRLINIENKEN
jgi:signal transduction histidine kinase